MQRYTMGIVKPLFESQWRRYYRLSILKRVQSETGKLIYKWRVNWKYVNGPFKRKGEKTEAVSIAGALLFVSQTFFCKLKIYIKIVLIDLRLKSIINY